MPSFAAKRWLAATGHWRHHESNSVEILGFAFTEIKQDLVQPGLSLSRAFSFEMQTRRELTAEGERRDFDQ